MTDRPDGAEASTLRIPRRRIAMLATAGIAVIALIVSVALMWSLRPNDPEATPPATSSGEPNSAFQRPAEWEPYRPAVHLTPAEHWMNDPQRPVLLDGVWHYYYLYNADYPDGNGTEWYHATSTDLVHWVDQGIAIEKYTTDLGDIWTGTVVVDHDDTAGFGKDAVIAVVTQQADGVQRQSLFVSRDGGYSFEPFEGNPVLDNPGTRDFRDPRVVWDDDRKLWIMALAEGERIGFYESPDLKQWTHLSDFTAPDLGVLECPDLFRMSVDGDPGAVKWVLVASANGAAEGMTTGAVYWIGEWDGTTFTPEGEHQWLDRGADYYAAVTWEDPRLSEADRLHERFSIGWLNNWAYAGNLPTDQWHGGSDSIVRSIRLVDHDGRLGLESTPIEALRELEGPPEVLAATTIHEGTSADLPQPTSDAYRVTVVVDATASGEGELRLRIPRGSDTQFATVGYDFATQTAFVARDADAIAERMPEEYQTIRTAVAPPRDGMVRLDIIVDVASVEVFVNDGAATLSMLTAGGEQAAGLRAEATGGDISLLEAHIAPLRVAAVERVTSAE